MVTKFHLFKTKWIKWKKGMKFGGNILFISKEWKKIEFGRKILFIQPESEKKKGWNLVAKFYLKIWQNQRIFFVFQTWQETDRRTDTISFFSEKKVQKWPYFLC